jgi:hypothetical protein
VLNDLSENSAGNYHSVLDVKTLPAGIYFLELKSSSTKIVRKVVVEKN